MTRRSTKRRKIVLSAFVVGLILYCVALLWLLPGLLKSPINAQLKQNHLKINYQHLWINPLTLDIHLREATLEDLSGHSILDAQKMTIDWQLWPLLNRHININHLLLKEATLNLHLNADNQLIRPALNPPSGDNQWQFSPGRIEVIDSSLYLQRDQQTLQIHHINLKLNMANLLDSTQTSNQPLLRFETDPGGEFLLEQNAQNKGFHWQIYNWPLAQLAPWFNVGIELNGKFTASGSLTWSSGQLPVIKVEDSTLNIVQLRRPPFGVQQANIKANNIQIDFNTQQLDIESISANGGELTVQADPLNFSNLINPPQASDNLWQLRLNALALLDWQITLQDNHPTVKSHVEHFILETENQQQNINAAFEVTEPFNHAVKMNLHGPINPVLLQGTIQADDLALERLNPWLKALDTWQFEHGRLTVDSRFCLYNEGFYIQGKWSLPRVSAFSADQRIETTQTSLQSIGLQFDEKILTLNNMHSETLDVFLTTPDLNNPIIQDINHAPPVTENLWRVVIGDVLNRGCEIKPL